MTFRTWFRVVPLVAVLAACGSGGPSVPDPMPETIPLPPISAEPLRWRPGYWDWTGTGYSWTRGEYVPLAGTGTHWMPGYWASTAGGQTWKPPHLVNR